MKLKTRTAIIFYLVLGIIGILIGMIISGYAESAIRPPAPPPVTSALPGVCLDGTIVCSPENPMRGDFNGNGQLDAGDLVILMRHIL